MPNKNKSNSNKLENSNKPNLNKLENFSEKSLNRKLNNNRLSYNTYSIYSSVIINLIVIIWCSFIINYLSKIDSCDCYNEKNKSNYANIKYLIIIEYLIIISSIIMIVWSLLKFNSKNNNQKGGGLFDNPLIFFLNLLSIIIFIYFVYYVYKFSENVNINCGCTQNWVRYLLYIQSFFILISIFSNLIMLFH